MSGLFGALLKAVLDETPVYLPAVQTNILQPISDDDSVRFLGPLLDAASTPPLIVNLAGDENVATQEIVKVFGELAGVTPKIIMTDKFDYPTLLYDSTRRRKIAGKCQVQYQEGFVRNYRAHEKRLRSDDPTVATMDDFTRKRA
jgi:hypothetical protein